MKCKSCNNKTSKIHLTYPPHELCEECFLRIIEKRVRKHVRINKLFKKNDKITIINDESKEAQVNKYLLKSIIKNMPVTITEKKTTKGIKAGKIIIPWNLDDEINQYLEEVINNYKTNENKKIIKLLKPILNSEVETFAKIKGFKYKKISHQKENKFIKGLEEKHPGTKFSLLKSSEILNKI